MPESFTRPPPQTPSARNMWRAGTVTATMPGMNTHGLNILLVDDEVIVTNYIKDVLTTWGHTVDVLRDGAGAFTRLTEKPHHYQLLITDHFMWKVSGVELMEQLQGHPFRGRIIVISGYLTLELESRYRTLGAHRIIRKPFGPDVLREAMEGLKPAPPPAA